MSVASEFRDFALKGNVVDLAVGVVIGAAFGKIVASLVGDVVMPLIGTVVGGVDFTALSFQVGQARVQYGRFIQTCFDFLIIAWAIFVAIQVINRMRKRDEDKPPSATPPRQEQLLEEIRDLLRK